MFEGRRIAKMGPVQSTVDFADAASVRQLIRTKETLVCLTFPDKTSVYSQYSPLTLASGVLSNVLEDTQQQSDKGSQFFTVPLDDADAAVWQVALGLIHAGHHLDSCKVTLENAQGLLLLAHKYEIPSITAQVDNFLSALSAGDSRLAQHLSPGTVMCWLTAASRCGLQQQAKLCIDYVVEKHLPVSFDALSELDSKDADQLLSAQQLQSNYLQARAARADTCRSMIKTTMASLKGQTNFYPVRGSKCARIWLGLPGGGNCPYCSTNCTGSSTGGAALNLGQLHSQLQP